MRIAVIDIGTNSIHLIVVRVRPDLSFEVIDGEKAVVRLGAGSPDGQALTADAMAAAIEALSRFTRIAESRHVEQILVAATSATREAPNGDEFLAAIARDVGITPRVIAGDEEARLIHRAAVYGVDVGEGRAVVIDIGGGSVEMTLGTRTAVQCARSFELGVIRMTERFVSSDPLSARDERRLSRHVRGEIGLYCEEIAAAGFDRVIGTSGTILNLGAMAASAATGSEPSVLRNLHIPAKRIRRVRKALIRSELEQRLTMPGLDPRRADQVVAGAVLLDTILGALGAKEITLCDMALREGMVLDYIDQHWRQTAQNDRFPDVRRCSTRELAERCTYDAPHAQQVVRLALALFDQSRPWHGLAAREREWLEYASMLHDVGAHIGFVRHHRHSYYLIKNGDLRGFQPEEIDVIALVARYHRRGTPKQSHREYGQLPRRLRTTVRVLASMLRLAESLDRSHAQVVSRIQLQDRGADILLRLHAAAGAELEVWAGEQHVAPFARVVGKPVRLAVDTESRPTAAG